MNVFIRLVCPFAPHLAEEMWHTFCGEKSFASLAEWPEYDPAKTVDTTVEVAVQISGKFKGTITLAAGLSKEDAIAAVKAMNALQSKSKARRSLRKSPYRISLSTLWYGNSKAAART